MSDVVNTKDLDIYKLAGLKRHETEQENEQEQRDLFHHGKRLLTASRKILEGKGTVTAKWSSIAEHPESSAPSMDPQVAAVALERDSSMMDEEAHQTAGESPILEERSKTNLSATMCDASAALHKGEGSTEELLEETEKLNELTEEQECAVESTNDLNTVHAFTPSGQNQEGLEPNATETITQVGRCRVRFQDAPIIHEFTCDSDSVSECSDNEEVEGRDAMSEELDEPATLQETDVHSGNVSEVTAPQLNLNKAVCPFAAAQVQEPEAINANQDTVADITAVTRTIEPSVPELNINKVEAVCPFMAQMQRSEQIKEAHTEHALAAEQQDTPVVPCPSVPNNDIDETVPKWDVHNVIQPFVEHQQPTAELKQACKVQEETAGPQQPTTDSPNNAECPFAAQRRQQEMEAAIQHWKHYTIYLSDENHMRIPASEADEVMAREALDMPPKAILYEGKPGFDRFHCMYIEIQDMESVPLTDWDVKEFVVHRRVDAFLERYEVSPSGDRFVLKRGMTAREPVEVTEENYGYLDPVLVDIANYVSQFEFHPCKPYRLELFDDQQNICPHEESLRIATHQIHGIRSGNFQPTGLRIIDPAGIPHCNNYHYYRPMVTANRTCPALMLRIAALRAEGVTDIAGWFQSEQKMYVLEDACEELVQRYARYQAKNYDHSKAPPPTPECPPWDYPEASPQTTKESAQVPEPVKVASSKPVSQNTPATWECFETKPTSVTVVEAAKDAQETCKPTVAVCSATPNSDLIERGTFWALKEDLNHAQPSKNVSESMQPEEGTKTPEPLEIAFATKPRVEPTTPSERPKKWKKVRAAFKKIRHTLSYPVRKLKQFASQSPL